MTNNNINELLKCAEREALSMHHPFIGTEHFILSALKYNTSVRRVLNNNGITYENYKEKLFKLINTRNFCNNIYTPLLKRILYDSLSDFNIENIFINIISEGEGIGVSILNNYNIDICSLYNKLTNNKEEIFGINLTQLAKENKISKVIGREKEINSIIEVLGRKTKCNPLLIGEAGVGKTAIVESLSIKINNNDVPDYLKGMELISLSMSSLVSGTKYRGEFEEKLDKIIKQLVNSNNKIIFIDEIHTLVGAGGAEGAIDASNILKPFLARNSIKCIGSTTLSEYNNSIRKDKALDRRFNKIIITEPNKKELKDILYGIKKDYEKYHNVLINNNVLDYIIDYSSKIKNKFEPDKSIDILDDICTKASIYLKKDKINFFNRNIDNAINKKIACLNNNDFNSAYKYKKNEIEISNSIKNYKPRITLNYVKSIINNTEIISAVGFKD